MAALVIATYFLLTLLLPSHATPVKAPLLSVNFPDPCIFQDASSGTWYAFATGGWWTPSPPPPPTDTTTNSTAATTNVTATAPAIYKNIQVASAPHPKGPWTYLPSADPLPSPGRWAVSGPEGQVWAPSVTQLNGSAYVLYYAALVAPGYGSRDGDGGGEGNNGINSTITTTSTSSSSASSSTLAPPSQLRLARFHCIGAATSTTSPLGPYTPLSPDDRPLICPSGAGGAIDPAAFADPATGRHYVVYKVDGNAMGSGGECNNGVAPFRRTPIVLQEIEVTTTTNADGAGMGVRLVGDGVELLDRDDEVDGPLVEAPDLLYSPPRTAESRGGSDGEKGERDTERYVLFYSNHCWDGPGYSVNYAVAEGNITGPYKREATATAAGSGEKGGALIGTGDEFNVTAPGGAASVPGGGWIVFHGNCPQGRCLFGAEMEVVGGHVAVS
ncbi:glycoside hydrolase [Corynascus novoguineensis]|uniref:Glycoside hydrolase n=1 Tax=Corynascus novoguineensis TaxID=1126955 RepID=A0AAN7HE18_9PEZI|nr:glycoside hydrolase [Corynascus novoguineensis]